MNPQPTSHFRPTRANALRPRLRLLAAALLAAAVAAGVHAEDDAVVAVAPVTRQDLARELTVQAELRPYQEIELHAKVAGYLRDIKVDIGDQVKAGDVLATLEVPELKEDLDRGAAAVQRAEAAYKDAHLGYTRLQAVTRSQPNLMAQQDLDAAAAKDAAAAAAVAEAKAEYDKYRTLADYTRITAPFSGVITKRFADPGALIQAGTTSSTQAMPIVRLSQNDRLRLDFPLSVSFAQDVKVGDPIDISLGDHQPVRHAQVTRFSRRITVDTRTMLVETDLANPKLELIPGMYASVTLKVDRRANALAVPVEAVSGTQHPTVFVVNAQHLIEERTVQLGIETPTKYEVLSGVRDGEFVMIGNRAQVHVGQKVTPKAIDAFAAQ